MSDIIENTIDRSWNFSESIYFDLTSSKELIYNALQAKCSELIVERESAEYEACRFKINSTAVIFRVAKITPTKTGQFVTLWKRIGNGSIQPYDVKDHIDFFIISTRKDDAFGQFIFPKSILSKYGIMSNNGQGGKRAIRVYPPWDITTNKQAKQTQAWQLPYFLEVPKNQPIDYARAKVLYNLTDTF